MGYLQASVYRLSSSCLRILPQCSASAKCGIHYDIVICHSGDVDNAGLENAGLLWWPCCELQYICDLLFPDGLRFYFRIVAVKLMDSDDSWQLFTVTEGIQRQLALANRFLCRFERWKLFYTVGHKKEPTLFLPVISLKINGF